MTLREARTAGQPLKTFVQDNCDLVCMRPYFQAIESLARKMEAMTVSAWTQQSNMHDFFCLRVLLMNLHQLQVPGRIKLLPSSCICTELDIVD